MVKNLHLILHGISGKPILAKTVNQKKLNDSIESMI